MRSVCCVLAGLGCALAASDASADIFNMPSGQISLSMVSVGSAGNPNDVGPIGAVPYNFAIGKYEVTIGQYVQFLNAVAETDTYSLYHPSMGTHLNVAGIARSGLPGSYFYQPIGSPNRPIAFATWGSAARFANWVTNGQPNGPQGPATTEDGSYLINGATSNAALMAITRKPGAQYVIPTGDEWYKSAYYDPTPGAGGGDNYWRYAMQTDTTPDSAPPPGTAAPNAALTGNFFSEDQINNGYNGGYAMTGVVPYSPTASYLTDVGAYSATSNYWGTFDQAGGLSEMVERIASGNARTTYGGSWSQDESGLSAGVVQEMYPEVGREMIGFRIALVPEPSAITLLATGAAILMTGRRKQALKTP